MRDFELVDAEAAYLEGMAEQLRARAKELRELKGEVQETRIEVELETLPWKEAASKKCDYVRDVPADLVEEVRSTPDGVKGKLHHFTASKTELTLFRFKRSDKK